MSRSTDTKVFFRRTGKEGYCLMNRKAQLHRVIELYELYVEFRSPITQFVGNAQQIGDVGDESMVPVIM